MEAACWRRGGGVEAEWGQCWETWRRGGGVEAAWGGVEAALLRHWGGVDAYIVLVDVLVFVLVDH